MTAVLENPPTTPDTAPDQSATEPHAEQVVTLTAEQVAQHPDNLRDPGRDLDALAKSIREVGVVVPLIVVPVDQVAGDWPAGITHVAVDGNRRQAAAARVGALLPCLVRSDVADVKATARTRTRTRLRLRLRVRSPIGSASRSTSKPQDLQADMLARGWMPRPGPKITAIVKPSRQNSLM